MQRPEVNHQIQPDLGKISKLGKIQRPTYPETRYLKAFKSNAFEKNGQKKCNPDFTNEVLVKLIIAFKPADESWTEKGETV